MTQNVETKPVNGAKQQTGGRPRKSFPLMSFQETLILPKGILDFGVNGKINRLTLLDKLAWTPGSSKTRVLISSSSKYGLTTGSYKASSLLVTDEGRFLLDSSSPSRKIRETQFELAINKFEPFSKLYEKLKNERLPDDEVLKDEFGGVEVKESDRDKAAKVFTENLRFLGLVREISGKDYVRPVDEMLVEAPGIGDIAPEPRNAESFIETSAPVEENGNTAVAKRRPALHIDIQVHIDPTSSADQIDQIFASMARHLYGPES